MAVQLSHMRRSQFAGRTLLVHPFEWSSASNESFGSRFRCCNVPCPIDSYQQKYVNTAVAITIRFSIFLLGFYIIFCFADFIQYQFCCFPYSCDANSTGWTSTARLREWSEASSRVANGDWQMQGYVVDWTRVCVRIDAKSQRRRTVVFVCALWDSRRTWQYFAACQ